MDRHTATLRIPDDWDVPPASWSLTDDVLTVTAGARTDIFVNPLTGERKENAPRGLIEPPAGDWQFSARLRPGFRAPWDAGALMIWRDGDHWAKLTFEQSPDGRPTVFSVVTRDRSDDAVGWSVDGDRLWLRISHVDGAFTFHASEDGRTWHLARQFALGPAGHTVRVGIEVQSPVGEGCVVDFDHMVLLPGPSRG
jgi:regulation of enolase protein 1 (concanavalin A-like superfamily)